MTKALCPVRMTGKLVALRELAGEDVAALHAVYGDPAVTGSLSFEERTLEQCGAIITAAQADAAADPRQVSMLAARRVRAAAYAARRVWLRA